MASFQNSSALQWSWNGSDAGQEFTLAVTMITETQDTYSSNISPNRRNMLSRVIAIIATHSYLSHFGVILLLLYAYARVLSLSRHLSIPVTRYMATYAHNHRSKWLISSCRLCFENIDASLFVVPAYSFKRLKVESKLVASNLNK